MRRGYLKKWHQQNDSGRRRRSEAVEALTATLQCLFTYYLQLESLRCAWRDGDFVVAPDAAMIAKKISRSPEWADKPPMSEARVRAVLIGLQRCGYLALSKQNKHNLKDGRWVSSPKVVQFKKLFFLHLGGDALWNQVQKEATVKLNKIKDILGVGKTLANHFRLDKVVTPRQHGAILASPPDRYAPA